VKISHDIKVFSFSIEEVWTMFFENAWGGGLIVFLRGSLFFDEP